MKGIDEVVKEIEQAGGLIIHNSIGGHTNKKLAKLIIITNDDWMFNAWFNFSEKWYDYYGKNVTGDVRYNDTNAPCYGPNGFIGCLKFLTVDEQLIELVGMLKNKLPSKLLRSSDTHEIIGY